MPVVKPLKVRALTKSVNDRVLDRAIRHAVYLERLKVGEVNKIVGLLNKSVVPDLVGQLEKRLLNIKQRGFDTSPASTRRLRQLLKSTNGIVQGGVRSAGKVLRKDLKNIAMAETEFQARLLKDSLPIGVDLVTPSTTLLQSITTSRPFQGRLLKDWMSGLSNVTQKELTRQVNMGLVQGEAIPAIVRRVRGVVDQTKRHATALVRTSVNHVTAQARELTYEQNSDIVKAVQYLATLDHRTTDICASLDGKVFKVGEGVRPPQHINCRSTTIPVTRSWKELGIPLKDIPATTRASMSGQVPAKTTYPQWLKKQPRAVQNQVLGKGKADLWRRGKFDLTKPILNGKSITLKQLRRLDVVPDASRIRYLTSTALERADVAQRIIDGTGNTDGLLETLKRMGVGPKTRAALKAGKAEKVAYLRSGEGLTPAARKRFAVVQPRPVLPKPTPLPKPLPPKPTPLPPKRTGKYLESTAETRAGIAKQAALSTGTEQEAFLEQLKQMGVGPKTRASLRAGDLRKVEYLRSGKGLTPAARKHFGISLPTKFPKVPKRSRPVFVEGEIPKRGMFKTFEEFQVEFRKWARYHDLDTAMANATHLDDIVERIAKTTLSRTELDEIIVNLRHELDKYDDMLRGASEFPRGMGKWDVKLLVRKVERSIDQYTSIPKISSAKRSINIRRKAWKNISDAGSKKKTKFKVSGKSPDTDAFARRKQEAADWFGDVTSQADNRKGMKFHAEVKPGRANAEKQFNRINMDSYAPTRTFVHEMGHMLDFEGQQLQRTNQFLKRRVLKSGDKEIKLIRKFYDEDKKKMVYEWGWDDDFGRFYKDPTLARYTGRWYGDKYEAIENVADFSWLPGETFSMGVEALYIDPIGFAQADPDFCKFIIGVLDGTLGV